MGFSLGVHLSLAMGPEEALPVLGDIISLVESIEVIQAEGPSGFQIIFREEKETLGYSVLNPQYASPDNRVVMTLYVGPYPIALMDGFISHVELVSSNTPGRSRVVVTGRDVGLKMDLDEVVNQYPEMPANVVVEEILAKHAPLLNLMPEVIPPLDLSSVDPLQGPLTQRGTDWQFLNYLAKKYGNIFYIQAGPTPEINTAYWGPPKRIGTPQGALSIQNLGMGNVKKLTFKYDAMVPRSLSGFLQDCNENIILPVDAPLVEEVPPLSAEPAIVVQKGSVRKELIEPGGAATISGVEEQAVAKVEDFAQIIGKGEIDVVKYGHILTPGIVGVQGAGKTYDGEYMLRSVTTKITQKGMTQYFELAREGLIALGPEVIPDI